MSSYQERLLVTHKANRAPKEPLFAAGWGEKEAERQAALAQR